MTFPLYCLRPALSVSEKVLSPTNLQHNVGALQNIDREHVELEAINSSHKQLSKIRECY